VSDIVRVVDDSRVMNLGIILPTVELSPAITLAKMNIFGIPLEIRRMIYLELLVLLELIVFVTGYINLTVATDLRRRAQHATNTKNTGDFDTLKYELLIIELITLKSLSYQSV